jgi:hypothetical protein
VKSCNKFLGAALAAVVLGCSAAAAPAFAGTNLVTNGDFSPPSLPYPYGDWGLYSSVNGWINNGDYVEIGLNSTYGLPCDGAICTNLEVNADQFTFDYGGRPGGGVQKLDVLVNNGATTTLLNSSPLTGNYGVWTGEHYSFTATGTSETIEFKSLDTSGLPSYGNEITNVSVLAVPEPATWALMLAGFGGMGVALRSRRRPASAA